MPTFLVSPLLKFALGALSAGAVVAWGLKEMRRINAELDRVRAPSSADDSRARQAMPTLRRDPRSGEWRVS
jgi:hypothetical protein